MDSPVKVISTVPLSDRMPWIISTSGPSWLLGKTSTSMVPLEFASQYSLNFRAPWCQESLSSLMWPMLMTTLSPVTSPPAAAAEPEAAVLVEAAVLAEEPPQAARPMARAETPATFMKLRRVILWIRIEILSFSLVLSCLRSRRNAAAPVRAAVRRVPSATCFPWRYTNISDYRRQDETAFLI